MISGTKKIIISAFFASFLFPLFALAVTSPDTENYIFDISPKNPSPNTTVTIKTTSYQTDLSRAYFIWMLNGKKTKEGVGQNNFVFNTDGVGKKTNVSVAITNKNGQTTNKNFSFNPQGITLLWEAQTYTPISYKGKALASSFSVIKASAIPELYENGKQIPPQELFYEWELDYKKYPKFSGLGKNHFFIKGPQVYGEATIKVTVSNFDKKITGEKYEKIPIKQTKTVVYEKSPLEGLNINKSVGSSIKLIDNSIVLSAEPYFFSLDQLRNTIFTWVANGTKINEGSDRKATEFNADKETPAGQSKIEINIKNNDNPFQTSKAKIEINFGQ